MEHSFTMSRAQVASTDEAGLRALIFRQTGCQTGAESIMRSLERMGTDPTIDYFEMTEISARHRFGAATAVWRVRADRRRADGWSY